MTCAFADWSQRRFPVESAGLPLFPPHSSQNNTWLHSGTRPRVRRSLGPDRSCHRLLGACTLRHTRAAAGVLTPAIDLPDIRSDLKPAAL